MGGKRHDIGLDFRARHIVLDAPSDLASGKKPSGGAVGKIDPVMLRRILPLSLILAAALLGQKYDGPRPPQPDIPYLKHADTLVATEVSQAKEEKRKDDIVYTIEGANSPVKTPLASPIFLFQSEKIPAAKLALYKLDNKNGHREILFSPKKKGGAQPIRIQVMRLTPDNLYKIEVEDTLENGEYSLSPEGSNQVFCFQVY